MKSPKIFVFILFNLCAVSLLNAQKQDTVWVQGKSILILGDTSFFVMRDTVLIIPDSVATFLRNHTAKSDKFYRQIKKTLSRYTLTEELYHILFDDSHNKPKTKAKTNSQRQDHSEHFGKIIGEVRITKLAVFGTDIDDTTQFKSKSLLLRSGNSLHNYTRRRVIRNHLFFAEGDILDPVKLEDSERTLRGLPYIKDARVLIEPVDQDEVNIVVLVKDNWSLLPDASFYNINRWKFILTEENFLGLGHEVVNHLVYHTKDNPKFGYRGLYRVRNIAHSFINVDISFAESDDYTTRGIRVYRNYIIPDIELAGGFEFSKNGFNVIRVLPDTVVNFDIGYNYQDVSLSHAYPVGSVQKRKRLVTGARYRKYDFHEHPEISPDSNYLYFSRNQYLMNIGLSKRNYDKSRLIYGYGRTEDIPIGSLISATVGKEYNQFHDRWYGEVNYSVGGYLGSLGYFRPTIAVGGFYRNKDIEQGIVKSELTYFSHLYHLRRFALRQFFYVNYTRGFRRFGNEYIDINNRNGIRGLESVEMLGTKKAVFRSETVSFTPFYLLGFRMAIFGFVDLGAVQLSNKRLVDAKIYQGYGLGIRFRNENLAFKSIAIQFGYYPNAPVGAAFYSLEMMGETVLRYRDFIVEPPSVIDFR